MKTIITGCQSEINGRLKNVCPFCNNILEWGGDYLSCKLGADLRKHSTVVLNFLPDDCPVLKEDYIYTKP
jgi:hypothetical protein